MPRKEKKYHYIYKTTCKINNKFYVGRHSTDDLNDGYIGSGKYLKRVIRKYGKENFDVEILEFVETRKDLVNREIEMVNEDLVKDPMCMNLMQGGEGGWHPNVGFCLPGVARKGRLTTNKILHERLQTDLIYRERVLLAISNGLKKTIEENGHNWIGKKHTEASKEKMSITASQRIGQKNSQFGTCWITQDSINKKIKKEDLSLYLQQGWVKGRITKNN
jgi:hypothetical protein